MPEIPIPPDAPMPAAVTAELITLLSILADDRQLNWIALWLMPEDFFWNKNAEVYRAMLALRSRGERVTVATVTRELAGLQDPQAAEGIGLLRGLINISLPAAPSELGEFVRLIRAKSQLRQLVCGLDSLKGQCFETGASPDCLLDRLQQAIECFRENWRAPTVSNANQLEAETQAAMTRADQGRFDA